MSGSGAPSKLWSLVVGFRARLGTSRCGPGDLGLFDQPSLLEREGSEVRSTAGQWPLIPGWYRRCPTAPLGAGGGTAQERGACSPAAGRCCPGAAGRSQVTFPEQTQPSRTGEGLLLRPPQWGAAAPVAAHPGPRKPVCLSWAAVGETGEAGGSLLTSAQPHPHPAPGHAGHQRQLPSGPSLSSSDFPLTLLGSTRT